MAQENINTFTSMKKTYICLAILVVIATTMALLILQPWMKEPADNSAMTVNNSANVALPASVPIRAEFLDKIVYGTVGYDTVNVNGHVIPLGEEHIDWLRADCDMRGWHFYDCGTTCEPGAEECVMLCAYTCERPIPD